MAPIKNIIFDLGGVILDLDFNRTLKAFAALGAPQFEHVFNPPDQSPLFDQFDKGLISSEDFFTCLKAQLGLPQPHAELEQAWNAMLLGIPGHRLGQLRYYKQQYQTFLLSNTNTSHVDCFENRLSAEHGPGGWEAYFHRAYYSCDIHLRKPDAAALSLVLVENNLRPEETLFIDDTLINLQSAEQLKIQTLHVPRGDEFGGLLEKALA